MPRSPRAGSAGSPSTSRDDVPGIFASVTDTALRREFEATNAAAIAAFQQSAAWFAEEEKRGTDGYRARGRSLLEMLRMTEAVDVPLDSLEARGREDLERNTVALREACGRFAPGKTLAACVAAMDADKPKRSPDAEASEQLDTLEAFVRAKGLVSIPGTEKALVRDGPAVPAIQLRLHQHSRHLEKGRLPSTTLPAGPGVAQGPGDAYVSGLANLLFASVHEVWPGHFLHSMHWNRVRSPLGRVFVGYAFAEGGPTMPKR